MNATPAIARMMINTARARAMIEQMIPAVAIPPPLPSPRLTFPLATTPRLRAMMPQGIETYGVQMTSETMPSTMLAIAIPLGGSCIGA